MRVIARIANNERIWNFKGKHRTLNKFEVKQINLLKELVEFDCTVKVRYCTSAVPCHVVINGDRANVMLDEAVFGLAKGQIAAFYEGDKLLGGGVIC